MIYQLTDAQKNCLDIMGVTLWYEKTAQAQPVDAVPIFAAKLRTNNQQQCIVLARRDSNDETQQQQQLEAYLSACGQAKVKATVLPDKLDSYLQSVDGLILLGLSEQFPEQGSGLSRLFDIPCLAYHGLSAILAQPQLKRELWQLTCKLLA